MAKFDIKRAKEALQWMEDVLGETLYPDSQSIKDQLGVKEALKDGQALCRYVN